MITLAVRSGLRQRHYLAVARRAGRDMANTAIAAEIRCPQCRVPIRVCRRGRTWAAAVDATFRDHYRDTCPELR